MVDPAAFGPWGQPSARLRPSLRKPAQRRPTSRRRGRLGEQHGHGRAAQPGTARADGLRGGEGSRRVAQHRSPLVRLRRAAHLQDARRPAALQPSRGRAVRGLAPGAAPESALTARSPSPWAAAPGRPAVLQRVVQRARSVARVVQTSPTLDNYDMSVVRTNAAASMLGVSPNTLRSWERRFGFPAPRRTQGGHRQFDLGEIEALRQAFAETQNGSSAVSIARERGAGPASWARLRDAFAAFD